MSEYHLIETTQKKNIGDNNANFIFLARLSKEAFVFQRKGDDYGKLFSIVQPIAKIFPKSSDFDSIKEASAKLHTFFKVSSNGNKQTPSTRHFLSVKFVFLLIFFIPRFCCLWPYFSILLLFYCTQKLIDKQIKSHDPTHERNFVDMYLTKMKEEEETLGVASTFSCTSIMTFLFYLLHIIICHELSPLNCMKTLDENIYYYISIYRIYII